MNGKHTFCPRLWDEVFVDKNGDVYTCCHRKPRAWGNIYRNTLAELWNNAVLQGCVRSFGR